MKIDFENLLPAEVIDRTRTTEKLVLGAILCHHSPKDDQLSIAIQAGIGPEDFCTPQHRTIYQSMLDTWGEAGTDFLDQVLQAAHYRLKEKPEYLYGMMDEGGSIQGQSLAWHARTLKSLSFDRQELTLVAEYGGSFSAEHGIGLLRLGELEHYGSDVELDLMRTLKSAIDPKNIMNPGKLLNRSDGRGRG